MFRLATYRIPLIFLLAIYATETMAQSGGNSKVITYQSPANNREIFVGILGEVAHPGVYHLDPQSLTLQSVIRRAGGLTDGASLTIRLVRGERVTQNIFFNPQTECRLIPGDLMIVESKLSQAAVSKLVEGDPRLQSAIAYGTEHNGRPRPYAVQIALLNVLDRPVFVPVKHEEANLLTIVQKLGQPAEMAQSVRVICPERLLSQAAFQPVNEPIADGSVLVFQREMVNRSRLPSLPPAFESGIATGAMPSLIGGRSGQSAELRNVGQLPPLMARQPRDIAPPIQPDPVFEQARLPMPPLAPSPSQAMAVPTPMPTPINAILPSSPMAPPANAPQIEIPPSPPVPVVTNSPRIANLPFSGPPPIKKSSTITSSDREPAPEEPRHQGNIDADLGNPIATESGEIRSRQSSASEQRDSENSIDDVTDETSSESAPKSSSITLKSLLGVVVCVALLIGVALATRKYVESRGIANNPQEAIDQQQLASPMTDANLADSSVWALSDLNSSSNPGDLSSTPADELLSGSDSIHDPDPPAAESFSPPVAIGQIPLLVAPSPSLPAEPIGLRQPLKSDSVTAWPPMLADNAVITPSDSRQPIENSKVTTGPRSLAEEAAMAGSSIKSVKQVTSLDSNRPLKGQSQLASRLDQLIRNELPIREERVIFPEQIVLQGRLVPPPVFRVDPKVAKPLGQGPHFESKPAPVEEIATKVIIVPEANAITDEVDGSHVSGPSKPHFMRRRAGEKTVAAAAVTADKPNPLPKQELKGGQESKSSSTPLTDALRQLQGGQS